MNSVWKKLLCTALSVALLLSVSGSALSAVAKMEQTVPVILVPGFGGTAVYNNYGTEEQNAVGDPLPEDQEEHDAAQRAVLADLALMLTVPGAPMDKEGLINDLSRLVKTMTMNLSKNCKSMHKCGYNKYPKSIDHYPEIFLNEDGEEIPVEERSGEQAYLTQLGESIGYENVYFFQYDYRKDAADSADQLNRYIQNVRKLSGSSKVSLLSDSEGCVVVANYMDLHMDEDLVDHCVFVDGAFAGVSATSLFGGFLHMDAIQTSKFLMTLGDAILDDDIAMILKLGVLLLSYNIGTLTYNVNSITSDPELCEQLYLKVFKPLMKNVAIFYEFIPYEDFTDATRYLRKIGFISTDDVVYQKIKKYHKVQGRLVENLKAMKKRGIKTYVIANYGVSGDPVTTGGDQNQTDVLIDTKYASAYATVADYGKTLDKTRGKYLSPDRVIDASTCALPNQTWFVRGVIHCTFHYNSDGCKLLTNMVIGKVEPSLRAVQKKYGFSQFVKVTDHETQSFSDITSSDAPSGLGI